ncbi:anhydro-N-acetylmuramic acid kinase [Rubellimicrobium sp. CFH 75288]|uniref:anhydro-N-acetylmuramic acid kinase n=1 Tax=Rubellimicrobium sp. CFH 75288 TaxID=2697034 RepID=UPI0014120FA0|nr:anhydro-N-acetylmuramic acid kinase [Rubellimicrobium sp. CFH 75288]NAZ35224.1 anhydro-N-acetylmuramic acid kinase [Rubellimicrobium sp. CFH 75288]
MAGTVAALGTMSGTSLDGVDAAILHTDGERIAGFGRTAFRPYSEAERETLRAALGRWDGPEVARAARVVEDAHAELLATFSEAGIVGFHGQTLAHDPGGRGTHQAGDGAALAARLGRPVVWDFRSADIRLGGQGAPLAPFYHHALARRAGETHPVAVLNLGGVGNLTWIDPARERPEEEGALLAFDTGPANAPLDDLLWRRRGEPFDRDGRLAAAGTVAMAVIEEFLRAPHFFRMPPKSLDRDAFAGLAERVAHLDDADAAATLAACCAAAVASGMDLLPAPPARLLVTGGGRRNPTLMAMIRAGVDCAVEPIERWDVDGDMVEAQAFAFLAMRVARGLPTSCPGTTGVRAAVAGGIFSVPEGVTLPAQLRAGSVQRRRMG